MGRGTKAGAVTAIVGLAVTACSSGGTIDDGDRTGFSDFLSELQRGTENEKPFVFGLSSEVQSLDPVFGMDGTTFQVTSQIYDTLLSHDGGKLAPGLAESWDHDAAGEEWTFTLREGVTFHDGGELTGDVVCRNFERWNSFDSDLRSITYYWDWSFYGYGSNSIFDGCEADGLDVTINLSAQYPNFPGAFSLEAFGILSPNALDELEDVEIDSTVEPPDYTQELGTLAGTGPFEVTEWDQSGGGMTLERFDDYWGETAELSTVEFQVLEDENAQRLAMLSGDIHGYDLVNPADVESLEADGYQFPEREDFSLLYLGFTESDNAALEDDAVREAIAYAIDQEAIVDTFFHYGRSANQFVPENFDAWNPDVPTYGFDPGRAKKLLEDAEAEDTTVEFCYPAGVVRTYLPDSSGIAEHMMQGLEEVGFEVEPRPIEWQEYIQQVYDGDCELHLLGWTGSYADSFDFLGTWFDGSRPAWGFEDDEIFDLMEKAGKEPDLDKRSEILKEANAAIMDYVPGVPIASAPQLLVLVDNVELAELSARGYVNFAELAWR